MSRVSHLAVLFSASLLLGAANASADPNAAGYGYPYPYPPASTQPAQPQVVIPQGSPVTVVVAPNAQVVTTSPSTTTLPPGWVWARPANCGEYRYWNGTECLDARDYPPDLGPR